MESKIKKISNLKINRVGNIIEILADDAIIFHSSITGYIGNKLTETENVAMYEFIGVKIKE